MRLRVPALVLSALLASGPPADGQAAAGGPEEEALAILRHRLGDEHPKTLTALEALAGALYAQGDYAGARARFERVLAERRRLFGDEHPATLTALQNLAGALYAQGDYAAARARFERVLAARRQQLGDRHPETLTALDNVASTLRALGDYAGARALGEEVSSARRRRLGDEHPETLKALQNLALTLYAQGDYPAARARFEQVLEARHRRLGDEHPETLKALGSLASTLSAQGDYAGARRLEGRVLEARRRRLGDEHPETLAAFGRLALTLKAQGDFKAARELEVRVLSARRRLLGDEHPATGHAMHNLATTLREAGDPEAACGLLERLIQLRQTALGSERRPNTEEEANTYFSLGLAQRDLGKLDEAYDSFLAGLEALEAQTLRADLSEDVKTRFKAQYGVAYRDALAIALARRKPGDALHLLERYRTESLLALLRWSRRTGNEKVPERYREELREIAQRYDRITRQLDALHPLAHWALLAEQTQLRRRREVIQGQIVRDRHSEEGTPSPLHLEAIRDHLDPGTLMLAYSIGEEGGYLFTLSRGGALDVHRLEATASQLWLQVGRLLEIDRDTEGTSEEARRNLSRWLYDRLLAPAAERIDRAERLLVLPDGPLHYLHFAALGRPAPDTPRGWRYLAESHPVHLAQSATVYAELQSRRPEGAAGRSSGDRRWIGFGNPRYPARAADLSRKAAALGDRTLGRPWAAAERGIWDGFQELPFTEREIRGIAAQFPDGEAETYLDTEATEDRAREVLGRARIAHLAAHGLADPEQPMDSFLALNLLEGEEGLEENGLLQAWEIVDHLRLDADLVVLSACVTAFGPHRGGEGLLSLSRAFQIAGARSVLASLWAVNDASTAELMIRFYRHLLAGKPKDRALQLAQLELIHGPVEVEGTDGEKIERDFSAPYHWAAFQLIGDWR